MSVFSLYKHICTVVIIFFPKNTFSKKRKQTSENLKKRWNETKNTKDHQKKRYFFIYCTDFFYLEKCRQQDINQVIKTGRLRWQKWETQSDTDDDMKNISS